MARKPQTSSFGTVEKLRSGRYRVRYYGPEGKAGRRYTAPTTFRTKGEGRKFLATVEADMLRNVWLPPSNPPENFPEGAPHARVLTLAAYSGLWLDQRDVKPRTREHYRALLDRHILPSRLARLALKDITADDIRAFYATLDRDTPTTRAHVYGLLRTVLGTAVTDGKIGANPCVIRGAGSAKRAVVIRPATVDELVKLTDAMPERYQAMILLASWCALRFGELAELRRADIDVEDGLLRVRRAVVRTAEGFVITTPKSQAGTRDVAIPPHLLPALRDHLADHVEPGADSLLFPAETDPGTHLQPSTLYRHYYKARAAAGRNDLRFHDLRHSGAVLAAATGATLAELMARLGHGTPVAALRYQHVAKGRDREIADALSRLAGA